VTIRNGLLLSLICLNQSNTARKSDNDFSSRKERGRLAREMSDFELADEPSALHANPFDKRHEIVFLLRSVEN